MSEPEAKLSFFHPVRLRKLVPCVSATSPHPDNVFSSKDSLSPHRFHELSLEQQITRSGLDLVETSRFDFVLRTWAEISRSSCIRPAFSLHSTACHSSSNCGYLCTIIDSVLVDPLFKCWWYSSGVATSAIFLFPSLFHNHWYGIKCHGTKRTQLAVSLRLSKRRRRSVMGKIWTSCSSWRSLREQSLRKKTPPINLIHKET